MPRVKRGVHHTKRRKNILKKTKGFEAGRKNLISLAKTASTKAGAHAYRDRRLKKRNMRRLWAQQLNAAVREHGLSYSKFIDALKKKNIKLDRKVLSQIAQKQQTIFNKFMETVK